MNDGWKASPHGESLIQELGLYTRRYTLDRQIFQEIVEALVDKESVTDCTLYLAIEREKKICEHVPEKKQPFLYRATVKKREEEGV